MAKRARRVYTRKTQRRAQRRRCGDKCFGDPRGLRFPVCKRGSCTPDCKSIKDAFMRAQLNRDSAMKRILRNKARANGCKLPGGR